MTHRDRIAARVRVLTAPYQHDPAYRMPDNLHAEYCRITDDYEAMFGRWEFTFVRSPWWRRWYLRALYSIRVR